MCAADVGDEMRSQHLRDEARSGGKAPRAQGRDDGLLSYVAAYGGDLHQ